MKKKLFLAIVMVFAFVMAFTFVVSAEAVHNENTVDYDATVTLDDGAVLPLYDENNEALIWYISGTKADGKNAYSSIRTDDSQVQWYTKSWGEVTSVSIALTGGATYSKATFVVVNMMDDDVVSNFGEGGHTNIGNPIKSFKWVFDGAKNLEYAYLRLDTDGIYATGFQGCSKLKYINLEDLTQLKRIGNNSVFNGCTSLFSGQILDLSKTKLEKIDDGVSIFEGVPIRGIILPETLWRFTASNTFKNCTSLETIILDKNITQVGSDIFNGCTALKGIFFVGEEEKLDTFIANAEAAGSNEEITGATKISYTAYKSLSSEEKASKTYIVYDYSWCLAYNGSIHEETTTVNACVGICDTCGDTAINHVDGSVSVAITYSDYSLAGERIEDCQNEGCTHYVTEEVPALFICLGYSIPENNRIALAVSYSVNKDALSAYKAVNSSFEFGVFAVLESKIGQNDILKENGEVTTNSVCANLTNESLAQVSLRIVGFTTDEHKELSLAMGIYTKETVEENTKYTYVQASKPAEGQKYSTITYNGVPQ